MGRTKAHIQFLQIQTKNQRQKEIDEYIRLKYIHLLRKMIAKRIANFIFKHYILPKRSARLHSLRLRSRRLHTLRLKRLSLLNLRMQLNESNIHSDSSESSESSDSSDSSNSSNSSDSSDSSDTTRSTRLLTSSQAYAQITAPFQLHFY